MLSVVFLASLRERLGCSQLHLDLPPHHSPSVRDLLPVLHARGPDWAEALAQGGPWRVAVNQRFAALDSPVSDGDEIAFLPPVTGG